MRALGREPSAATRLLRQVTTLNRAVEQRLSARLGLNPTDYRTMGLLLGLGEVTPTQLSTRLGVSPALVSLSLERLQQMGHVHRRQATSDGRRRIVTANPESAARVSAALLPVVQASENCLDQMTDAERDAVERYLSAVADALVGCRDQLQAELDAESDQPKEPQ